MKVNCISKSISFTSGKVSLYSDFDGTYFPVQHSEMHSLKPENAVELKNYFNNFGNFLNESGDSFTFRITTGRTFGEFETITDLIRSKGIEMPFPDTFISKNGSDEFIRIGERFSDSFPYDYATPNPSKTEKIQFLTGWHAGIKDKIRELLAKYNFNIIEHDSEYSPADYGNRSLMYHVPYDNFELQNKNMPPQSEWKVGLRKDGTLKLHISFPYDMLNVPEREAAYSEIKTAFEEYLTKSGVRFTTKEYRDKKGGNRPVLEYTPAIEEAPLNKLFDTKLAVEEAALNNDLVIVAGDGINDFEMLNPLNYIDKSDLDDALKVELSKVSPENIKNIAKNPVIIEKLKRLPFIGIVINSDKNELKNLLQYFPDNLIFIDKGNLQDGIKKAVEKYSSISSEFAKSLKKNIEENTNNSVSKYIVIKPEENKIIKSSGGKVVGISAAVATGLGAIIFALKRENKKD